MAKEIERKFIVRDTAILKNLSGRRMLQGYLSATPVTTRVRIVGEEAFLTIKGRPSGITCDEFEYAIPMADAQQLMALCGDQVIEKTRYTIALGERIFEVDVFHGLHEGLVLAEVELPAADTPVDIPEWLGEEVSGRYPYTNAYLAMKFSRQGAALQEPV